MQTPVEIGPSNASQVQHRRKDAKEQMKNLTLARTRTDFSFVPLRPFFCAALAKRWNVKFRHGFAYLNNNVDSKRQGRLYNITKSTVDKIMKNTIYIYICIHIYIYAYIYMWRYYLAEQNRPRS